MVSQTAGGCGVSQVQLEGVDELSSRVFRSFLNTLRLHRRVMVRTLGGQGAHPGQAFCLRLLSANDGITQRDIADELHLSRPTVSKMLQAMEKAGAVERRPDENDQRLTRVYVTDVGRRLEKKLRAVSAGYIMETIGTLPEQDRRELGRLLDDLSAGISRALAARDAEAGAVATVRHPAS